MDEGGRWRDGPSRVFDTKRDANAWEVQHRKKGAARLTSSTLAMYVSDHQAEAFADISPSTRATYKSAMVRVVGDLGHRGLVGITALDVERLQRKLRSSGLSASSIAASRNALSAIYRHAIKSGVAQINPVLDAKKPRPEPRREVPTLTVAQVEALSQLCAVVSPLYGDYVRLAAYTGLRAGELTALQVGDVDWTLGVINVRRAWSKSTLQSPKNGRGRRVPIVDPCKELLTRLTVGARSEDWLLQGEHGGRLHHGNFRNDVGWVELVRKCGFGAFRFHDLRATAIVLWIKAGVPLSTVRAMAGHASLNTTDRYVRIARNDLEDATAQMNSYMSRTSEGRNE